MKIPRRVVWIAVALILAAIILSFMAASPKADPNLVSAIAGIWVAAATLILALVTVTSIIESHYQTQYTQRSLNRPLLMPTSSPNQAYFPDKGPFDIDINNMGHGVALNIRGLLMPYVLETTSVPQQYSARFSLPLAAATNTTMRFSQGGTLFTHQESILGVQFGVPKELAPEEGIPNSADRRDRIIARLTVTYSDIFDEYHASVYDYTAQAQWVSVANLDAIPNDLGELDRRKGVVEKK